MVTSSVISQRSSATQGCTLECGTVKYLEPDTQLCKLCGYCDLSGARLGYINGGFDIWGYQ